MATDALGRNIDYLRISVTDKCNYRCLYCMPEEGISLLCHEDILSIEEIARFVRLASQRGIKHIRITGGEPLVRRGILDLIEQVSGIEGIESVALTTNASMLDKMARPLRDAGLTRINISLDTLDPEQFRYITRRGELSDVLAGIDAALAVGFDPVKVNCVAIRSLGQDFGAFAQMTIDRPLHVRFIEFMPVGHETGVDGCGWDESDVIPSDELRQTISDWSEAAGHGPLVPVDDGSTPRGNGPASYYKIEGAPGTIGFISSVSNHFCSSCNRLRLTADGCLRPCLFSDEEVAVREALRQGSDDEVLEALDRALRIKPDAHHQKVGTERMMSKIGG